MKISIIVPVYNTEAYLPRCIDSILAQTFTDFELILVDDGSPDNCGAICDRYAEKDSRIHVIHKENGGVSSARNFGIDFAHGDFVVFIDSDDCVDPTYLEQLLQEGDYDFVSAGFLMQLPDASWLEMRFCNDDTNRASIETKPSVYMGKYYFGAPWAKLFRRDILEKYGIRFPLNIQNAEDTYFIFRYLPHCKKIKIVSFCGYHYFFYNGSLAHRVHPDNFIWQIQVEKQVMCFFKPSNQQEENWLHNRLFKILMSQTREHYSHFGDDEIYELYRNELFKQCISHKKQYGNLMDRVFVFSMDHKCYKVYCGLYRIGNLWKRIKSKIERTFASR